MRFREIILLCVFPVPLLSAGEKTTTKYLHDRSRGSVMSQQKKTCGGDDGENVRRIHVPTNKQKTQKGKEKKEHSRKALS